MLPAYCFRTDGWDLISFESSKGYFWTILPLIMDYFMDVKIYFWLVNLSNRYLILTKITVYTNFKIKV